MPLMSMKRRTTPSLTLIVLVLSAAVFAWGTQSKLSLYQRPSPSHPISVAKLLPDDQASKKGGLPHSNLRKIEAELPVFAAVVLTACPVDIAKRGQASGVVLPAISPRSYALFFRPPPMEA
jgi:hypothetical protein